MDLLGCGVVILLLLKKHYKAFCEKHQTKTEKVIFFIKHVNITHF